MRTRLWTLAKSGMTAYAAALLVSAILGRFAIAAILEKAGRPAVPLDDAFIHFQFARRFAEGAPFRYTGDAVSSGATSLVWPALLAPFWKAGARGLSLVWVAWLFGTIAHAGVAVETGRLAKRLAGGTGAIAAGAMCLAFGPFAWFAWSGMETMALAWILVATARLSADVLDGARSPRAWLKVAPAVKPPSDACRTPPFPVLAALGFLAPFVRPEGALASMFAALAIFVRARGARRAWGIVALAGVAALPLLWWTLTGDPTGTTARVKWLVHNPYFDAGRLAAQMGYHARLLLFDVWDGGEWTWIFVPKGLVLAFMLGAVMLLRSGRRAPWTAAITLALILGAFATCSYQTFLWNRLRYAWPFVPGGFVLCACLADEVGQLLRKVRAPLQMATPVIGGAIVARLAALLPDTFEDLSTSARAVDQQQVKLGEWVNEALPRSAIVGVNDTGAIAYLGERRTFDIVGLTTAGAGPAWVAGVGSRYERFERMDRAELPTHFLVYPEWFGCDALLGDELTRATVLDHAILGGDTMVAYEADFSLLGVGATPVTPSDGADLVDEVDVADLASEAAHGFALGDAWDTDDVARELSPSTGGAEPTDPGDRDPLQAAVPARERRSPGMIDGGRTARARDSFFVTPPARARALYLVLRVSAEEPVTLRVMIGSDEAGTIHVPKTTWYEAEIRLPFPSNASNAAAFGEPGSAGPIGSSDLRTPIDVIALDDRGAPVPPRSREHGPRFASFHYWLYAR